ncbi:hypothetical protein WJX79_002615 [Trebouxia sp. C0005]
MPGRLARLFSTPPSASQQARQLEQPAAASKPTALPDICEQLRAVSDAETVLTGLRNLGEVLRRSNGQEICTVFLCLSPRLEELSVIWETQALVRHEHISTALLLVSAQLAERDQQLGSTIRCRANATLYLLAAITSRGTPLTTRLVKTLDMSLPALVNLAHPPKKKDDDTAGKSSLLRSWDDKDPLKRPSCALLVTLIQAILRHADAHTLTTTVSSRPLMAALLHHLSVHPHAVVVETLQLIGRKILHESQGLPASLQAEAFSDNALLQLAYVSEREGGGRRALDASNAAHSMLMALGTHHSHGMVPTLEGRGDDEAEPECEEVYQKPSTSAGQARFHRLLHKLKVTEVERHAELLLAVAAASPAMAADYLSSCALNMEPKASSSRWLVGMTVVGQLVQAAAKAADPFQQLINRSQQPPQLSSPLVQAFICQMSPPCLPRAVLSKGIQHPDALVRHTTLCTLLKAYQSCLPEAMSDSRIDVVGLMPQGVLDLPVLQQHALLELQLVRFPSSSLSPSVNPLVAFNTHYSAASFLPVLKLLTGSASHGVRQLAGQLLTRRIIDLLGGAFEDEVALWLGLLPNCPHAEVADATWTMCVDGVLGFLAEALASLGRRPQFYWGLMQSLLPSRDPAAESGSPPSDPPFSLLVISAVQQALKVACFSKLPSDLPAEAQPLASLLGFAQGLLSRWQYHGTTLGPNLSKLLQADRRVSDTPQASRQGGKKKRKGEEVASGQVHSRKKQKSGPEAEESVLHSAYGTLQVEMQEYGAARRLDLLLSQCEHQASSQARGQANQQLQLLTALYQCPVSVVQQKMPFVLKLGVGHDEAGGTQVQAELLSRASGKALGAFCQPYIARLTDKLHAQLLQSGLDLADALINLVIGSHKSGGLSRLDHLYTDLNLQGSHGSQGGAAGGQEGVQDAWARIIGGLLAVALRQHGDKAIVLRADMLLLRLSAVNSTKPAAAVFARCIGSCQQQLQQYLRLTLQKPTATSGAVAAQLMRHDPSLRSEFATHFDISISGDKVAVSTHTRIDDVLDSQIQKLTRS